MAFPEVKAIDITMSNDYSILNTIGDSSFLTISIPSLTVDYKYTN